jgi:hypothetical protein
MVKQREKLKNLVVKLPPNTVKYLTNLAGGRNHRSAYLSALLYQVTDDFTKFHVCIKAHWIGSEIDLESEELQEIGLKLPPDIIEKLNKLSGGSQFYTRYITALVWGALWMPALIQVWMPKISAPRPNFKIVNSNLLRKSKSPHVVGASARCGRKDTKNV